MERICKGRTRLGWGRVRLDSLTYRISTLACAAYILASRLIRKCHASERNLKRPPSTRSSREAAINPFGGGALQHTEADNGPFEDGPCACSTKDMGAKRRTHGLELMAPRRKRSRGAGRAEEESFLGD